MTLFDFYDNCVAYQWFMIVRDEYTGEKIFDIASLSRMREYKSHKVCAVRYYYDEKIVVVTVKE